MFDLNDLYLYTKVVEHGGFAPAGRVLGLPKSRLSRRVALLEERLGVRLIQRSTRQFAVTEVGLEYYHHCVSMMDRAYAAEDAIERSRAVPSGIIRLACSTSLLDSRLAPMLARFMAECPVVELLVKSYNRRVDVIGEGFDLVLSVRHRPLESSELVMRKLADSRQCLVVAPRLLIGHEQPLRPRTCSNCRAWAGAPMYRSTPGTWTGRTAPWRRFATGPAWCRTMSRCCARVRWQVSVWCCSPRNWCAPTWRPGAWCLPWKTGPHARARSLRCSRHDAG